MLGAVQKCYYQGLLNRLDPPSPRVSHLSITNNPQPFGQLGLRHEPEFPLSRNDHWTLRGCPEMMSLGLA